MLTKETIEQNKDYFNSLERIRQSGVCNMWGASPYLQQLYPELTDKTASKILITWIENYSQLNKELGWGR